MSAKKWANLLPDVIAYALAAALVLAWLFMAPSYYISDKGRNPKIHSNQKQKIWINLFNGTHTTDWLLVAVGSLQVGLLFWQSRIYSLQASLQKTQHIALHRARLIVREVERRDSSSTGDVFISFHVVNVGGSEARPVKSTYEAAIRSKRRGPFSIFPLTIPDLSPPTYENFLSSATMETQEERVFTERAGVTAHELSIIEGRNHTGIATDEIWVFHGSIYYADLNRTIYRTSFWREYNFESRRFVATDNTDYEHAH